MKRVRSISILILILTFFCSLMGVLTEPSASAETDTASQEIGKLLESVKDVRDKGVARGQKPEETQLFKKSRGGYLRNLGAPPYHYFPVSVVIPGRPEQTARNFLKEYATAFGVISTKVDFRTRRIKGRQNRTFVRFQETYAGLTVFGAEVMIQLNEIGGVEYVLSDIARHLDVLDKGTVSIAPAISGSETIEIIREVISEEYPGTDIETTTPQLEIFVPSVIGDYGDLRLVWVTEVYSEPSAYFNEQIIVDAHTGEIVRRISLNMSALLRDIFDSNNSTADPGTNVRSDVANPPGPGVSGIADADDAYDLLEYTYDFYYMEHGRDSIDGAGMTLSATVRYCYPFDVCPWENALWRGGLTNRLYFGDGWTVDDVVAHEYTHGVTKFESNLTYLNQSGAINESFSDIWGEFVDLSNVTGTDTPAVKWLQSEDTPAGANRDMQDPPNPPNPCNFDILCNCNGNPAQPDRMGSPLWYTGGCDGGGVHVNSGVGNKLAYLLTDGDIFNNHTVIGMGISRVADLFYITNAYLLTSSADYIDLYHALMMAAAILEWTSQDRNNLLEACLAVEIEGREVYVDGTHTGTELGTIDFPFNTVIEGKNAADPGDLLLIKGGSYNEIITFDKRMNIISRDGTVIIGQ